MDILRIKDVKKVSIVEKADAQEILAFDASGDLVKIGVETKIEPISVDFVDQDGAGNMSIIAKDNEVDGFNEVYVNASEYGNAKETFGYERGLTEGIESVLSNIGNLYHTFNDTTGDGRDMVYAGNNGLVGFDYVEINASEYGEQRYQDGLRDGRNEGGNDGEGNENCNLQDKWIEPFWENLIDDNFIIITPDEGYDGMHRVVMIRTEATAPNWLYSLYVNYNANQAIGDQMVNAMTSYSITNNGSLSGVFDEYQYTIGSDRMEGMDMAFSQGSVNTQLTDISYMYNGDGEIPLVSFAGFDDCSNVENCEGAFNGWTKLSGIDRLTNLGNSFKTEQTLDLSMTKLKDNYNLQCLAKSLYNFNVGPNQYGVERAYIKGLGDQRYWFEDKGWVCIDE